MTPKFTDLPPDIQTSIKGILEYLLQDSREAEDFVENDSPSHVWISITYLENFAYGSAFTPAEFAEYFLERS